MSKTQLCRTALYFVISLFFHASCVGLVYFPFPQQSRDKTKIEFEVKNNRNLNVGSVTKSAIFQKKVKSKVTSKKTIPAKFIPSWYDLSHSKDLLGVTGSSDSNNLESLGVLKGFGYGSNDLSKLSDFGIYDYIYRTIESTLVYPWILADKKMEAVVNIQTRILSSGSLDWQNLKVSGGTVYFQVYVLRILKTVFNKFPAEYSKQLKKPIPLDLSFTFKISENGEKQISQQKQFIMGQVIAFHRVSHQSMAQWKLGPLSGLFPLPYVNLDLSKLFSLFSKEQDPLLKHILENQL